MLIKIIAGGYGFRNGRRTELKDKSSPPFSVDEAEARRLVALGIAEIIDNTETEGDNENEGVSTQTENIPDMDLSSMSVSELRKLAKEHSIQFKVGATKEFMIASINACLADEMPDLSAADPL